EKGGSQQAVQAAAFGRQQGGEPGGDADGAAADVQEQQGVRAQARQQRGFGAEGQVGHYSTSRRIFSSVGTRACSASSEVPRPVRAAAAWACAAAASVASSRYASSCPSRTRACSTDDTYFMKKTITTAAAGKKKAAKRAFSVIRASTIQGCV